MVVAQRRQRSPWLLLIVLSICKIDAKFGEVENFPQTEVLSELPSLGGRSGEYLGFNGRHDHVDVMLTSERPREAAYFEVRRFRS